MTESNPTPASETNARRLLRYRYPLFALLFCNALIVAGVPFAEFQRNIVSSLTQANAEDTPAVAVAEPDVAQQSALQLAISEGGAVTADPKNSGDSADSGVAQDPITEATEEITDINELISILDDEPGNSGSSPDTNEVETPTEPAAEVTSHPDLPSAQHDDGSSEQQTTAGEDNSPEPIDIASQPNAPKDEPHPSDKPAKTGAVPSLTELARPAIDNISNTVPDARDPRPDPTASPDALALHNPKSWGTKVHFAIDGEILTLYPGETLEFDGDADHTIQFHCGGSFGTTEVNVNGGAYQFNVTDRGWALVEAQANDS